MDYAPVKTLLNNESVKTVSVSFLGHAAVEDGDQINILLYMCIETMKWISYDFILHFNR